MLIHYCELSAEHPPDVDVAGVGLKALIITQNLQKAEQLDWDCWSSISIPSSASDCRELDMSVTKIHNSVPRKKCIEDT